MGVGNALNLTTQEINGIALMLGVCAVAFVLCLPYTRTWIQGYKMRQQRRHEVQQILSDGYADMIMNKVMLKEITWEEARDEGFRRLKQAYPTCKDMFPSEETLKERISARLGTTVNDPVKLPDGERKVLFARRK